MTLPAEKLNMKPPPQFAAVVRVAGISKTKVLAAARSDKNKTMSMRFELTRPKAEDF